MIPEGQSSAESLSYQWYRGDTAITDVTGVTAVGCTTIANNDDKLTGITAVMEYQLSGAKEWITGTGKDIINLAAGELLIKRKAVTANKHTPRSCK